MKLSPADKAMLITFGSACFLMLLFFSLGVKPYQKPNDEAFIEIPIIRDTEKERPEKSRRKTKIKTHKAYNTSKIQKEVDAFFEEEDPVRKAMKARKLKSAQKLASNNRDALSKKKKQQQEAFKKHKEDVRKQIEARELERKRRNERAKGESTVSYHLSNRSALRIPNPVYTCDNSGTIVLNITVSASGIVTKINFNKKASNSTNGCLIDQACAYAKGALFNASTTTSQTGSITFNFQN